jgi:PAS domain S-box-containing protein
MDIDENILIVDDDSRMCDTIKVLLKNEGYTIKTAHDGRKAMEYLSQGNIDLALLDIVMPEISGLTIMDYINTNTPETQVIVITGYRSEELAIESLRKGAYDYLKKPFEPEKLITTVGNALHKQRLKRENGIINEKLSLVQTQYKYLVDSSPDIIYTLDQRGKFTFVNQTVRDLLGFEPNQLLGKHFSFIIYEKDLDKSMNHFNEKRTGKRAVPTAGIRLRCHQNGNRTLAKSTENAPILTAELRAVGMYDKPVDSKDKHFMGTHGVIRDISLRLKSEKALRESRKRLNSILDSIQAGILLSNFKTHEILYANHASLRMIGLPKERVVGSLCSEYLCPEEAKAYFDNNHEKNIQTVECAIVKGNGQRIPVLRTARSIELDGKKYVLDSFFDISQTKALEIRLQRAQKMEAIGTLAGGVAHDLNNVLSAIVSYPELLLMKIPEDSPLRKPLLTIQESGKKAADIVNDLLTLARRGAAVMEVINLNTIISDYVKTPEHEKLISYYPNIEVILDLEPGLLNAMGSTVHISKTIMNLISNAAEAIQCNGKIIISTENRYIDKPVRGYDEIKEGDYVILKVTDGGVGIRPEDVERIFEPFYTKKKMGRSGTGLGMAVVWGTVKDHEGYIEVQSEIGKGSTFTLYFPATRNKIAKDVKPLPFDEYKGEGESILVVDDIEEQRNIAECLLSELGYAVTSLSSGLEAIEYMKDHSVDMIILDMIMEPGLDGLETYREIIKFRPGQKAIIASGFSETERVKEAQVLGVGQYIKKPYTLERIGLAVKNELKK